MTSFAEIFRRAAKRGGASSALERIQAPATPRPTCRLAGGIDRPQCTASCNADRLLVRLAAIELFTDDVIIKRLMICALLRRARRCQFERARGIHRRRISGVQRRPDRLSEPRINPPVDALARIAQRLGGATFLTDPCPAGTAGSDVIKPGWRNDGGIRRHAALVTNVLACIGADYGLITKSANRNQGNQAISRHRNTPSQTIGACNSGGPFAAKLHRLRPICNTAESIQARCRSTCGWRQAAARPCWPGAPCSAGCHDAATRQDRGAK
jgi:hypothetical protein